MDSRLAAKHATPMVQTRPTLSFHELEQRALALEAEGRLEEAREAFDAALNANPDSQLSAEGRARIALALNEDDVAAHCSRALAYHDAHPDRQLRMILTAAPQLGGDILSFMEEFLWRNPQHALGHESFSELRAEWGAGEGFADNFIAALEASPGNRELLFSYWNTLSRAQRFEVALDSMDAHRSLFEGDRDFLLLEVNIASHAGLMERTAGLIDQLDERPDSLLARGQHRMQTAALDGAASDFEAVAAAEPDNLTAWALLEVAWRMVGDPRHDWLINQPGLYGTRELGLDGDQLNDVACALRRMHRTRAQPIGQSLRGGTQTAGQLFLRNEPQLTMLTNALAAAIRDFVGSLPAEDASHPLLKHRNMGMAFGPSWSVRFTGSGHHAAHFHPNGILSSACYIAVPEQLADPEGKPGWLEIGRPPPELGLDLPPLATVEPRTGRLVLFPSFMFHGTRPFAGGERLSVAFDLVPVPMDWPG